jgi:hypothetical protein
MYLGLGLRLGSGTFAGFDADAAAYFNRAGVTNATAKAQINEFVKGVKALGLYNSMVCWPLRSAQNAGTGMTAYSLGGLGTFDGTFAGATLPTWNADGVNFTNDTAAKITTSLAQGSSDDINIFSVVECNAFVSEANCICGTRGGAAPAAGSSAGFTCAQDWYAQGAETLIWFALPDSALNAITTRKTDGSFNAYTHRIIVSSATKTAGVKLNTASESAVSGVRTYTAGANFTIGNQSPTSPDSSLGGKLPFLAYFKTASLSSSVYTLYKTTMGTGLGLP